MLAYNEATGQNEYDAIEAVHINDDPETLTLTIDDERIETTPHHPFYTQDRGWTDAGALAVGEQVRKDDGTFGTVHAKLLHEATRRMYNLTVARAHTFFVGTKKWLVHNVGVCNRPGGYQVFDIDTYENLSPTVHRATGNTNTVANSLVQAHHPIQDAWARANVIGYSSKDAPAVLLRSAAGEPHAIITGLQATARNQRLRQGLPIWGTTIQHEFAFGYNSMIQAGVPRKVARQVINDAYKYFHDLGAI